MKKIILTSLVLFALSACASDAPAPTVQPNMVAAPHINLDVQSINLIDHSSPTNQAALNMNFQPSIQGAVRQWVSDRLAANGRSGDAVVTIKDASMTYQALPLEHGFSSWFTRQQASKYLVHAEVEIVAHKPDGYAVASAEASRWVSLPEDPTESERKDAYYTVLNGLIRDLGKNLESNIQDHMQSFLVRMR